jgi:hypothetical protein
MAMVVMMWMQQDSEQLVKIQHQCDVALANGLNMEWIPVFARKPACVEEIHCWLLGGEKYLLKLSESSFQLKLR